MNERDRFITEALLSAVGRRSGKQQTLQNGLIIRNEYHKVLATARVPTHPRFQWVRKQARAMLELLIGVAKDYQGPGDRGSMADALDIARMCAGNVESIIQNGYLDPEKVELVPFEQVEQSFIEKPEENEDGGLHSEGDGAEDDDGADEG